MAQYLHLEARDIDVALAPIGEPTRLKFLIHGINFYPEFIGVGKYTGELAFHLAAKGHEVEVVTAPPHYPGWVVTLPYVWWRFRREQIKGVSVLRCPILTRGGRGVDRALAPLSFAAFAAPAVLWRILRTRPDVVVCVEPTLLSAPAAVLGAKLVGARAILHVQDLEVDAAFDVGHLQANWVRHAALSFERWLLKRFDGVVTISQKMRAALVRKGAPEERTIVVRNWVDLDAIRPIDARNANSYRSQLGLTRDQFVTLYSGHIGRKQALNVVLEAALLCIAHERLHFVIAGNGPERKKLESRFGHLSNVTFLPLQPPASFNELLGMADLHVLPQSRAVADLVLPSKLGAMLASGRPVVATADSGTELAGLLDGCALLVPAEQPEALAAAIMKASRSDLDEMVKAGLNLALRLSSRHVLPAFEAILEGPRSRSEKAGAR